MDVERDLLRVLDSECGGNIQGYITCFVERKQNTHAVSWLLVKS